MGSNSYLSRCVFLKVFVVTSGLFAKGFKQMLLNRSPCQDYSGRFKDVFLSTPPKEHSVKEDKESLKIHMLTDKTPAMGCAGLSLNSMFSRRARSVSLLEDC